VLGTIVVWEVLFNVYIFMWRLISEKMTCDDSEVQMGMLELPNGVIGCKLETQHLLASFRCSHV
jgi:hypothetical protein